MDHLGRTTAACQQLQMMRTPLTISEYPKALATSLPPWLLQLLSAGAVAGWDSHLLESAAFPRRTPEADSIPPRQSNCHRPRHAPHSRLGTWCGGHRGRKNWKDDLWLATSQRFEELRDVVDLAFTQLQAELGLAHDGHSLFQIPAMSTMKIGSVQFDIAQALNLKHIFIVDVFGDGETAPINGGALERGVYLNFVMQEKAEVSRLWRLTNPLIVMFKILETGSRLSGSPQFALNVSAGAARFRQLSGAFRKTNAQFEIYPL